MSRETERLAGKFMELRKAGVPTWVTSDEAFRMTDGRVGEQGNSNGADGFNLAGLILKASGDVHPL